MQSSRKVCIVSKNSQVINYFRSFHLQTQQQQNYSIYRVRNWLTKFHNYHGYDVDGISNFFTVIINQNLYESDGTINQDNSQNFFLFKYKHVNAKYYTIVLVFVFFKYFIILLNYAIGTRQFHTTII